MKYRSECHNRQAASDQRELPKFRATNGSPHEGVEGGRSPHSLRGGGPSTDGWGGDGISTGTGHARPVRTPWAVVLSRPFPLRVQRRSFRVWSGVGPDRNGRRAASNPFSGCEPHGHSGRRPVVRSRAKQDRAAVQRPLLAEFGSFQRDLRVRALGTRERQSEATSGLQRQLEGGGGPERCPDGTATQASTRERGGTNERGMDAGKCLVGCFSIVGLCFDNALSSFPFV